MIRHQQSSTFNRNISYQQRRSREISQISQNNRSRNQRDQQRLIQSNYHVSYDGQIVYSKEDLSLIGLLKIWLALLGGSFTIGNLVTCCFIRILGAQSKNDAVVYKLINRLSLIFYIPLILLNSGRILDFTLSLRQRLVEILHPKGGAGDGPRE